MKKMAFIQIRRPSGVPSGKVAVKHTDLVELENRCADLELLVDTAVKLLGDLDAGEEKKCLWCGVPKHEQHHEGCAMNSFIVYAREVLEK
jgi:hypothetical protein